MKATPGKVMKRPAGLLLAAVGGEVQKHTPRFRLRPVACPADSNGLKADLIHGGGYPRRTSTELDSIASHPQKAWPLLLWLRGVPAGFWHLQ